MRKTAAAGSAAAAFALPNDVAEYLRHLAKERDMSPHTVTAHIKKIYRKLAVHSRGEAVYEATQMGLLKN